MSKPSEHRNVIAIPSEAVLKERLAKIESEAKRLKLLIRTAKELDRIHSETLPREGHSLG
jgi:hypothetical protein